MPSPEPLSQPRKAIGRMAATVTERMARGVMKLSLKSSHGSRKDFAEEVEIAISKALKAKKLMQMNPNLAGSGKATAALIIGIVGLVLWILGMIAKVTQH